MRKIVSEAIESVPLITKDHILLVQTLLGVRWIRRSEDIIELYHKFILSLLTSKNDFLLLCLSKIIECFIPDGEWCMIHHHQRIISQFPAIKTRKI